MEQNVDIRKAATRTLAIFAFIFIIIIGIFGSLLIARNLPGMFSGMASAVTSLFVSSPSNEENSGETETPAPTQTIFLSLPSETVSNNQTFTLSWGHTGKTTPGSYSFRYDCAQGVSFASPQSSGTPTSITCGESVVLSETVGSIALTARSTATQNTPVVLHIDFIPEGQTQAALSGSITLTVEKATPTAPGNTGTGTVITYPTTMVSDPNGYTDLSVRVVSVGAVNRTTGVFYPLTYPSRSSLSDRIALRFEVKNEGTKTSPQWFFRANLPTTENYVFNSQAQTALRPGESIIFTLAFDNFINASTGTVTITVDPSNYVAESNENNNFLSHVINTLP